MRRSFPDFDNAPLFRWLQQRLEPLGAYDSSWHNDTCPSLSINFDDSRLSLHVDYKNENHREFRGTTFIVYDDALGDFGTESPREALREFACMLYQRRIGYRPDLDCPTLSTETILRTLQEHMESSNAL